MSDFEKNYFERTKEQDLSSLEADGHQEQVKQENPLLDMMSDLETAFYLKPWYGNPDGLLIRGVTYDEEDAPLPPGVDYYDEQDQLISPTPFSPYTGPRPGIYYHEKDGTWCAGKIHHDKKAENTVNETRDVDSLFKKLYAPAKTDEETIPKSEVVVSENKLEAMETACTKSLEMNGKAVLSTKKSPDVVEVVCATEEDNIGKLNFDVELLKRIRKIQVTSEGEKPHDFYSMKVAVYKYNRTAVTFLAVIKSEEAKDFCWVKKATHSLAQIPHSKEEKKEFEDKIQHAIETENVPLEIIYPVAGWRNVPGYGPRYVYQGGMIGENKNMLVHTASDKYTLDLNKEVPPATVFEKAIGMLRICPVAAASWVLWLFLHVSILCTLYEEAGHPLNFLMGVNGITNSRKTSLALAITKLFDRDHMVADAEFATATAGGIEKVHGLYKDAVVIIDDFKPGIDRHEQRQLTAKLDTLARFNGNRVEKKRMMDFFSNADEKFFPIYGGCVMTMEHVEGVTSSLSRMFLTNIEIDSVDNERLAYYQKEKWILPTHIYHYLEWVTNHYENVIKYIKKRFPELRLEHEFEFGRYDEMYATLMLSVELLIEYARANGFWTETEYQWFHSESEAILCNELRMMGKDVMARDKSAIVVKALTDALLTGKIVSMHLTRVTVTEKAECYNNDAYIFIRADYLKKKVNDYCRENYETCLIMSDNELFSLLEKLNLLEVLETEKGRERSRKLPIQTNNPWRYIYLKKAEINKLLEE